MWQNFQKFHTLSQIFLDFFLNFDKIYLIQDAWKTVVYRLLFTVESASFLVNVNNCRKCYFPHWSLELNWNLYISLCLFSKLHTRQSITFYSWYVIYCYGGYRLLANRCELPRISELRIVYRQWFTSDLQTYKLANLICVGSRSCRYSHELSKGTNTIRFSLSHLHTLFAVTYVQFAYFYTMCQETDG